MDFTLSRPQQIKTPVQPLAPAIKIDYTKFTILCQEYNSNQDVTVDPRCNGWTVINNSTLMVRVNGMPLKPPAAAGQSGESFTIGGNAGEIYTGRIQLVFTVGEPAPSILLVMKNYI